MCGIAGFDRRFGDPSVAAGRLRAGLAHRGPDGSSVSTAGPWELVHTRLAIIDLSDRVRYPLTNETGDLQLVYNGEIYDHWTLRSELERRGHVFATDCDGEVVVHGWEEWGADLLPRLHGMFAFAIADRRTGELVLARDRLGIKPLVRTVRGPFAFGSDALELVAAGLASEELDEAAVGEFLAFHHVPAPRTGLRDVEQVAPGTLLRRQADGAERVEPWAATPFADSQEDRGPAVSYEDLDAAVAGAVTRQLVADVDVGVFLSSGIDSALILSYAVAAGARPTALTIGFRGVGDYDESAGAGAIAHSMGVPHVVRPLEVDFQTTIDAVGRAYDVPLADPSAIATLALAELAREHVTVALSGTGGDDLFAGYYRHRASLFDPVIDRVPRALRQRLRGGPARGGERTSRVRLARSYAARFAEASLLPPRERYLRLVAASTSDRSMHAVRCGNGREAAARRVADRHGLRVPGGSRLGLDAIQAFELRTYLASDLLVKEDRATMRHGVEARVPLLDDSVVDLASRIPERGRATWREGKRPLRAIAARRLPPDLVSRGKRGFAVPLEPLLAGPWRDPARAWLREVDSELVDGPSAADLVGTDVPSLDVWALCTLAAWDARRRGAGRTGRTQNMVLR